MDELQFLRSVIAQVMDNLDGTANLAMRAKESGSHEDYLYLAHEVDRLAERHTDLLNLSRDLVDSADSKVEKAMSELMENQ